MEATETASAAPPEATTAPDAQPAVQPEAEESGAPRSVASTRQQMAGAMNAFLRDRTVPDEASTSKPAEGEATGESALSDDGDEKPVDPFRGADGRFLPRRAVPEVARQVNERLAAVDPVKLRAEIRAEIVAEQQQATTQQATAAMSEQYRYEAELFDAATRMPDSDTRLSDLVQGDPQGRNLYQWREDRKELIAKYPEAEAAMRADADHRAITQVQAWDEERRAAMRQQIHVSAQREGINPQKWLDLGANLTWDVMSKDIADAREARVRAEVKPSLDRLSELERELQQLRPQALGAQRAPVAAGRSSSAAPQSLSDAMNGWLRNGAPG